MLSIFSLVTFGASDSEFRNIPVLDRFRNCQTVLFREKRKKMVPKLPFFGIVPELKYSRSLKIVTKLLNRSKQSHFPAQIHHV